MTTNNNASITANNGNITLDTVVANIAFTSAGDIEETTAFGHIKLNAPNIDSFGYANPICFTRERADTFTYNYNGTGLPQTMEQVYFTSFSIPIDFVASSPVPNYTSTLWKIDFALNTWNNTVTSDKGIALYFTFQDATAIYNLSPQTYNANTPYAVYQPASTYISGSGNNAFQNYNWTDFIDLAPLVGLGSGVLPLNLLLNFAADSAFATPCNFQMVVTLTRTNLV